MLEMLPDEMFSLGAVERFVIVFSERWKRGGRI